MLRSNFIAILAALACSGPAAALACGGFFCSNQPVDQTGEQILFITLPNGNVQSTVSIAYEGETADFAWVVPVPGVPELSVGSDQVFAALNGATAPAFQSTLDEYACDLDQWYGDDDLDSDGAGGDQPSTTNEGEGGGVTVLLEETVGNYEAFVVGATAAQPLMDWLNCNEFRIATSALPLVESYIADGMNFLALKLQDAQSSGALTPITMEFGPGGQSSLGDGAGLMIPIVLTAVATQPNLTIRAWFAGSGRAVPQNYDLVWPNDALVDWTSGWTQWNSTWWTDLIGRAANAAGGRAFVPEYAGPRPTWVLDALGPDGGWNLDPLRSIADPARVLDEILMAGVPRTSLMQDLIRRHIPMPQALIDEGVTEQQFYNNLSAYQIWFGSIDFNASAFIDDIQTMVTGPVEDARLALQGDNADVLTALATTISGWEMTTDPTFTFLADGVGVEASGPDFPRTGGVPQVRQSTFDFVGGDAGVSCYDVAQVVDTESGVRVVTRFANKGVEADMPHINEMPACQDLPAALVVERWSADGEATIVQDFRPLIAAQAPASWCAFGAVTPAPVDPPDGVVWPPNGDLMPLVMPDEGICEQFRSLGGTVPIEPPPEACGCSTSATPGSALGLLLVFGLGVGLRRRR